MKETTIFEKIPQKRQLSRFSYITDLLSVDILKTEAAVRRCCSK